MNKLDEWALLTRAEQAMRSHKSRRPTYAYRGQEVKLPSRCGEPGSTTVGAEKKYTGSAMLGIATMHKSNAVPVFSSEEAENISRMRR